MDNTENRERGVFMTDMTEFDFAKLGNGEKYIGVDQIRKFFGWSKSTYHERKTELIKAGVIFYRWRGRPPRKTPCAMRETLLRWIVMKAKKGETI
jgi:hypothetical protein